MLTGIVIENYRVFVNEIEIELKPLTIFTGPNNSGKSSILNVLDIFKSIFKESASLRELVKNGIPSKVFDEMYGGFDNLFSIDSGKEKMKLGFLCYSKQMRTEFKYVFEFLKNGKIEKYSVEEKTAKEYIKILEIEFHDNKKDKDSFIQFNFTRINEIITNLEIRKKLVLEACKEMTIKINDIFGSTNKNITENNLSEYEKYINHFKNKYKQIIKNRGKIKFTFITDWHEIKNKKDEIIYIVFNHHKITEKEFNEYFSGINEIFTYDEMADGPFLIYDNPIVSHLSKYEKCSNLMVDLYGNTFSVIENINHQLNLILKYIEKEELQEIIKHELDFFQKDKLHPILKKYKNEYNIDIEIDFSENINAKSGLNNFDKNEGLFKFIFLDEIENIIISDKEIIDNYLDNEEIQVEEWQDFLVGYEIINLIENEQIIELNYLLKKYYPTVFKKSNYVASNLLGQIIMKIYSKIKFESDNFDYFIYPGLFSSLNENSSFPYEDIVHLNISSIYNIPSFIFSINAFEFIQKLKNIGNIKNKKLFNDETLIFYADRLLNHNLINQCSKKEKLFLTEIFIHFVKNKLTKDIYSEEDNSKLIRQFSRDLNAYANPKNINGLSEYSGNRQKQISKFLEVNFLNFNWIKEDFSKYFISHNSNSQITRISHFQQNNEISKLLNYFIHSKDEANYLYKNSTLNGKEYVTAVLKEYLNEFDIADDVEIEILKKINAYNIYLINYGRKILLQDNGYGSIQLFAILLFFSIRKGFHNVFHDFTYLIKEPERNLHPALQSKLGVIFSEYANMSDIYNNKIIIETHSEYLIRKVQTLVAKKTLNKEKVLIYYISNERNTSANESKIKKIKLNERGVMSEPFGTGFFDETDSIVNELIEIRLNQTN